MFVRQMRETMSRMMPMVSLLILAGGCSRPADPSPPRQTAGTEDTAVAFVEKLGGKVTRDEKVPGRPVIGVDLLGNNNITAAGMKELAPLKDLTTLDLRSTGVTDAVLKELAPFRNLTKLYLHRTQVTGAGLRALAPLKNLADLDVPQVTDHALAALREINLLHALSGARTANKGRAAKPEDVTELYLIATKVTNAGLKELAPFKNLTDLDLMGTQVTDAGLKELAPVKNLATLKLLGVPVTDAGLKELAPFKNLTYLELAHTKVTDAGLQDLASFKNLTILGLRETKVTDAGVKELQTALPKCKINR